MTLLVVYLGRSSGRRLIACNKVKNVLVEVDSSVGELAEGAALLDLGSLLSVLSGREKSQHFVLHKPSHVFHRLIIAGDMERARFSRPPASTIR